MVGAIIGTAVSALGSIVGSAMSASAQRKAERERLAGINKQRTRNENLLNYEMGAPRYAAQTQLNQLADKLRDRKAARTGTQKVVGGTQASVQAGNQADAEALGSATETAVSQGLDQRKDAMRHYTDAQNALDAQEANVKAEGQEQRSINTANATKALTQTAGQFISGLDTPNENTLAKPTTYQERMASAQGEMDKLKKLAVKSGYAVDENTAGIIKNGGRI